MMRNSHTLSDRWIFLLILAGSWTKLERLDWFYVNFSNDGRPILISTAHCMSIVYHFLPILWCTSFLPLPSLLSLTFRQRRSSQSTNCPKQEKNRGEKKFHFFVNLVSLVGLEPGDDEMLVQQMWWLVCWMGGWLETFKVLLVTIVFVGKVIRPGQSFWMVGGRSLGGAWMRLPRPLPGIPPPCLPTILLPPPCLPNLPTLLWPHNHHPTHSKPPCQPCQAGMDFPEQNSKTSKF